MTNKEKIKNQGSSENKKIRNSQNLILPEINRNRTLIRKNIMSATLKFDRCPNTKLKISRDLNTI